MHRSIFITGAGIGKACATLFAQKGWLVCATDVNQQSLLALKELLGNKHHYCHVDVTDKESISAALTEFTRHTDGHLDLLLNNAGILFIDEFTKIPLEKQELLTQINVNGVMNMTFLAKPFLDKSKHATVINMCSASANYGVPSVATYSASKFWVKGFTEAINIEWETDGIHVCDILPNFVATPMMDACDGDIVKNVGVKFTANDIAKTIWQAAHNRKKIHWHMDSWVNNLSRHISKLLPQVVLRTFMKKLAGY